VVVAIASALGEAVLARINGPMENHLRMSRFTSGLPEALTLSGLNHAKSCVKLDCAPKDMLETV
jgi:hypothetical protein